MINFTCWNNVMMFINLSFYKIGFIPKCLYVCVLSCQSTKLKSNYICIFPNKFIEIGNSRKRNPLFFVLLFLYRKASLNWNSVSSVIVCLFRRNIFIVEGCLFLIIGSFCENWIISWMEMETIDDFSSENLWSNPLI